MEDKTIVFKRPVLENLCLLLPMLFKNSIMIKPPIKLRWGSISWDSQSYSITVKGDQIPSPIKGGLPLPVKPSEGPFRNKV